MKITAIICHHKGDLILKAIKSLKNQYKVDMEIIVATSDKDRTFFGTKTIYVQGGPAHKRNVAFRFVNTEYVAFFDDDIEAKPIAVFEMASILEKNKDIGMVFGKLLNMEFHDRFDEAGSYLTWSGFLWARAESGCKDYGQYEDALPILAGKSASCMIRSKVFSGIGLFDSSYEILGEETDLAWRVWLSGSSVFYVPSSVTLHAFNTKFKPTDFYNPKRVYFNGSRNYIQMLLTNLSKENLVVPLTTQFCVWFGAGMGMFLTGKFKAGYYILKGLFWVLANLKHILEKRDRVQSSRKISDKELFLLIKRNPPISYYVNRFFHYIKTGRHG